MGNTPNVRFKGFTEDWEQRKLGDLVIIERGGSPRPINKFITEDENGLNWVKIGDAPERGNYITQTKEKIRYEGLSKTREVHPGDLILSNSMSFGRPYIMAIDGCIHDGWLLIRDNEKRFDLKYLCYMLGTDMMLSQYKQMAAGSTVNNLNKELVGNTVVKYPSPEEQSKMGDYFSIFDNLITLHQQKCDETKEFKKYMLQNMFPQKDEKVPKIRFDGFTGDWEQRKLEDFGKATGGTSIESEFSEDGIYKVISIGSYSENSVYNDQGIRAIKSDKTNNRVLNRNDLTMILNDKTTSGNIIGRVLLIEESGIYVYNQRTERIEINLDEYDPVFLYEMLNAPNIREKIIKQAQGNTQIYVNWTAISLLKYMIPSKEEQVKIGEYLHSISNLITLHQRKCDKYSSIKKGMMSDLLTGKIRLV